MLALTLSCSHSSGETTQAKKKYPNIVYILADDLGYGDVKCFNAKSKIPTPNMDAMASNGIMFTDAHTSSSVCTPTRYGILTGRYNWRTTLKSSVLSGYSKSLIKKGRTTVADLLKQQGYSTAFIGKWHLGWDWKLINSADEKKLNDWSGKNTPNVDFKASISNGPDTHGFNYSYGFCGSLDMAPYVWVENGQPTMVPDKFTVSADEKGFWRKGLTSDDFDHTMVLQHVTDKALNYIAQSSNSEKPFFLYLPLPAPHTPILPTTEFLGKSNTNMYGDFVMQVDDVLRQVREALKKNGISENTLLVFTSDNGCSPRANLEELAEVNHFPSANLRGGKADIYEGGHRVPFIVEWPEKVKNIKVDKTICTTDFLATCADIIEYDLKDNEGEDSYSMLPFFNGKAENFDRPYTIHHSFNGSFAIRQGKWKLNMCPGSAGWSYPTPSTINEQKLNLPLMQLFDLENDIAEKNNLIEQNPDKAKELAVALLKIIIDGRSTKGVVQKNEGMDNWTQFDKLKELINL
jgi:arylsulfatase A-like enzyme